MSLPLWPYMTVEVIAARPTPAGRALPGPSAAGTAAQGRRRLRISVGSRDRSVGPEQPLVGKRPVGHRSDLCVVLDKADAEARLLGNLAIAAVADHRRRDRRRVRGLVLVEGQVLHRHKIRDGRAEVQRRGRERRAEEIVGHDSAVVRLGDGRDLATSRETSRKADVRPDDDGAHCARAVR